MLFSKMHGAGNDYVFVNCIADSGAVGEYNCNELKNMNLPQVARRISDRNYGIGADGLVLIKPSLRADAEMEMYNADGSTGAMCGNAIRCVGRFLYDNGLASKTRLSIGTASGVRELVLTPAQGEALTVSVDMGEPVFDPTRIPMAVRDTDFIDRPVMVGKERKWATAVSMGNPHWVFFVHDTDALNLAEDGPLYEWHELFPHRVNTEFVQVEGYDQIRMRVWERGSGETLSCGTGACAAAVAACACGRCGRTVTVTMRGGVLSVNWDEATGHVFLTGNAVHVFDGEFYF